MVVTAESIQDQGLRGGVDVMAVEEDEEAEALGRGRRKKKTPTELRGEPVASKKQCAVSSTEGAAGKLGGARRAVKKKKAPAVKKKMGQRAGTFTAAEEAAGKLGGAGRAVENTKKTVVTKKKGEAAGKLGGMGRAVEKKRAATRPEARTGFLGVSRAPSGNYRAYIRFSKGIVRWLGTFGTAEEAARAYDAAAVELQGSNAVTNFKSSGEPSGQAAGSVKTGVKKPAVARPDARTEFRGVHRLRSGTFSAQIWDSEGQSKLRLGTFGTAKEAARAYDAAAVRLHGGAARTNFEQQHTAAAADDGEVSSMDFLDDFPELPALDFSESLIPGPQKDDIRRDSSPAECQLVHEFLKDMGYADVVA
jgi:hypothetical protein